MFICLEDGDVRFSGGGQEVKAYQRRGQVLDRLSRVKVKMTSGGKDTTIGAGGTVGITSILRSPTETFVEVEVDDNVNYSPDLTTLDNVNYSSDQTTLDNDNDEDSVYADAASLLSNDTIPISTDPTETDNTAVQEEIVPSPTSGKRVRFLVPADHNEAADRPRPARLLSRRHRNLHELGRTLGHAAHRRRRRPAQRPPRTGFFASISAWFNTVGHRIRKMKFRRGRGARRCKKADQTVPLLGETVTGIGSDTAQTNRIGTSAVGSTQSIFEYDGSSDGEGLTGLFDQHFPGVESKIVNEMFVDYQVFLRKERLMMFFRLEQAEQAHGTESKTEEDDDDSVVGDFDIIQNKWDPEPILRKHITDAEHVALILRNFQDTIQDLYQF